MKVFLSWSGNRSRAIAEVMRNWLPSVLQAVRPYFSPDDVSKGSRWSTEIAKELEASRIALLFITPDNPEAPWLVFEAGALSKNLDRSKVCPLLFGGIEPTDIKGPLVQFQAAKFDENEMKRVLKMINTELGDSGLAADVLDSVFEMWWPKLDEQVSQRLQEIDQADETARRPDRELLEEILMLSRRNSRMERPDRWDTDHPAFRDLVRGMIDLCSITSERYPGSDTHGSMLRLLVPLEYIAMRGRPNPRLLHDIEQLKTLIENEAPSLAEAEIPVQGFSKQPSE